MLPKTAGDKMVMAFARLTCSFSFPPATEEGLQQVFLVAKFAFPEVLPRSCLAEGSSGVDGVGAAGGLGSPRSLATGGGESPGPPWLAGGAELTPAGAWARDGACSKGPALCGASGWSGGVGDVWVWAGGMPPPLSEELRTGFFLDPLLFLGGWYRGIGSLRFSGSGSLGFWIG